MKAHSHLSHGQKVETTPPSAGRQESGVAGSTGSSRLFSREEAGKLTPHKTWVGRENITLSERSQLCEPACPPSTRRNHRVPRRGGTLRDRAGDAGPHLGVKMSYSQSWWPCDTVNVLNTAAGHIYGAFTSILKEKGIERTIYQSVPHIRQGRRPGQQG